MIESESGAPIRVERRGPVTTVILDRPGAKNAVDRDTAAALADAFRAALGSGDVDLARSLGVLAAWAVVTIGLTVRTFRWE